MIAISAPRVRKTHRKSRANHRCSWLAVAATGQDTRRRSSPCDNSLHPTRGSSRTKSSLHPPPTPQEPLDVLRSAWKAIPESRAGQPESSRTLGRKEEQYRTAPQGWRSRGVFGHATRPDIFPSVRPLTAGALSELDRSRKHDVFCRCELCFGSLDVSEPGPEQSQQNERGYTTHDRRRRQTSFPRHQVALLPMVRENDPDWTHGLNTTETFVRMQTLPSRHALADGPCSSLAHLERHSTIKDASNHIALSDALHADVESWEEKWNRELRFMNIQQRLGGGVYTHANILKPAAPATSSSTSTRVPTSRLSSRPPSCASSVYTNCKQNLPSSVADAENFRGAWAVYNAASAKLEAKLANRTRPLCVEDVPWPPPGSVCGLLPEDTPAARKRKFHKALLRWHPDKWHKALQESPEKAELAAKLAQVTQQILLERGLA